MALTNSQIEDSIEKANKIAQKTSSRLKKSENENSQIKIIGEGISELTSEISNLDLEVQDQNLITLSNLFAFDNAIEVSRGDEDDSDSDLKESLLDSDNLSSLSSVLKLFGLEGLSTAADVAIIGSKLKKIPEIVSGLTASAAAKIGPMIPYVALIALAVGGVAAYNKLTKDIKSNEEAINSLIDKPESRTKDGDAIVFNATSEGNDGFKDPGVTFSDVLNNNSSLWDYFVSKFSRSEYDGNITLDESMMTRAGLGTKESKDMLDMAINYTKYDSSNEISSIIENSKSESFDYTKFPRFNYKNPIVSIKSYVVNYYTLEWDTTWDESDGINIINSEYNSLIDQLIDQLGKSDWILGQKFYYDRSDRSNALNSFMLKYNGLLNKRFKKYKSKLESEGYLFPDTGSNGDLCKKCFSLKVMPENIKDEENKEFGVSSRHFRYWFGGSEELYRFYPYADLNKLGYSRLLSDRVNDDSMREFIDSSIQLKLSDNILKDQINSYIEGYGLQDTTKSFYGRALQSVYSNSGVVSNYNMKDPNNLDLIKSLEYLGYAKNGAIDIEKLKDVVKNWDENSTFVTKMNSLGFSKKEWENFIEEYEKNPELNNMGNILLNNLTVGTYDTLKYGPSEEYINNINQISSEMGSSEELKSIIDKAISDNKLLSEEQKESIIKSLPEALALAMNGEDSVLNKLMEGNKLNSQIGMSILQSLGTIPNSNMEIGNPIELNNPSI